METRLCILGAAHVCDPLVRNSIVPNQRELNTNRSTCLHMLRDAQKGTANIHQ